MIKESIWVDIDGYKGLYQINQSGGVRRILNRKPIRILKTCIVKGRKCRKVSLSKKNIQNTYSVEKILRDNSHKFNILENEFDHRVSFILKLLSNYYEVPIHNIIAKERGNDNIVLARQMSHKLLKITTKLSLSGIGKAVGDRAHDTVLNSIKSINNQLETNKKIYTDYLYFLNKIEGRPENPITDMLNKLIPL